MIKKGIGQYNIFQSEKLRNCIEIEHFFSGSDSGFAHINQFINQLELDKHLIVFPKQTHSDHIEQVTIANSGSVFRDTDAVITNEKGIMLVVKTADCVPILLFDPVKKAIAAVHSGWRGTSMNIIGKTVREMIKAFGSSPSDLIAAIGPCIGSSNYEVGSEVIDAFRLMFTDMNSIVDFNTDSSSKGKLNLKEVNKLLLLREGLISTNIDISTRCTYTEKDHFFSARRDGYKTGRMINGIVLK